MKAVDSLADPRQIDRLVGGDAGPTFIVVGAVHGNEPAGVNAAREVLARLRHEGTAIHGEIIALTGNVRALAGGKRYLARDLNRQWTSELVAAARAGVAGSYAGSVEPELQEVVELAHDLDAAIARARGQVFVLDLHTTSAEGPAFAVVGETGAHRAFAAALSLPGIVGLEAQVPGVLTAYLSARWCVTVAVEGGEHASSAAEEILAAAVTVGLHASGVVAKERVPGFAAAHARLELARGDLPQRIEVVSRHAVEPEHEFRMEPGFATIQPVTAGTLLARDRTGEIRAPFDAILLLPLYQPGTDGFFLARS